MREKLIKEKVKQMMIVGLLIVLSACNDGNYKLYKDVNVEIDERVEDLLKRMTIEEKAAQMIGSSDRDEVDGHKVFINSKGELDLSLAKELFPNGLGHINRSSVFGSIDETVAFCNEIQQFFVEETRLGIPLLLIEEGLHGHMANGATLFPSTIALGSTWNPSLLEEVFSVVAKEVRARGENVTLNPVLDVARDPRWGRFEETMGEDPYLISTLGLAIVNGLQGRTLPISKEHVAATMKHYAAHGQPESGMNSSPPNADESTMFEIMLPAFKRVVQEGNVMMAMASYNEVNGIPVHVNSFLLRDILRDQWGFKGILISDGGGIRELISRHYVAADTAEAVVKAITAGVNMELPGRDMYKHIPELVKNGKLSESLLDDAVRHILYVKFNLGLFEDPYTPTDLAKKVIGCDEHRQMALKAAQEAIILLKNENNVLPIDKHKLKKIAVIGPNANTMLLGGYSRQPKNYVTPLEGIKNKVGQTSQVIYSEGCKLTESIADWYKDEFIPGDLAKNKERIRQAVQAVKGADVIILVLGENESIAREGWSESHLGDKSSLQLRGNQDDLFDQLAVTGIPIVTVLLHNGPLAIKNIYEKTNALLDGWYLGQESGTALADVLFGDVNPGGKLPATVPQSVGQVPVFYNHKTIARRGYVYDDALLLFPFGFGLSYTTFEIKLLGLSQQTISSKGKTTLQVEVTNSGSRMGSEVIQLYVRDQVASVTRPVKELIDFEKIWLKPGEKNIVEFEITTDKLTYNDGKGKEILEPGEFILMAGNSSQNVQTISLFVE
ncbi:MAG: glycoside hydrolase family 3 N-terminal domain-containing protein [Candidatus Paceibacterota bacterium]